MTTDSNILGRIRRILGRPDHAEPLAQPPTPPRLDEPITRLVHMEIGLDGLFTMTARANHIGVSPVDVGELPGALVEFLRASNCAKLALPVSPLLESLGIESTLRESGFAVSRWDQMQLDDLYDIDCGITDAWAAVAETGSLVMRASPQHGRAISLVPPIHVAIVHPRILVPDLVDLFEKLAQDGAGSNTTIISGPSKTADIEMNLVEGMHGPGVVQVFLLK